MKDQRGHVPELVDPVAKVERCRVCKDTRRRGEKWTRACPGDDQDRRLTPLLVPLETGLATREGRYSGRTKTGG